MVNPLLAQQQSLKKFFIGGSVTNKVKDDISIRMGEGIISIELIDGKIVITCTSYYVFLDCGARMSDDCYDPIYIFTADGVSTTEFEWVVVCINENNCRDPELFCFVPENLLDKFLIQKGIKG
jgi:hypothetical protein